VAEDRWAPGGGWQSAPYFFPGSNNVIRYGSVCSGIEAPSVAWHGLGWQPQWFAEIATFPSAVLAHHWAHVPNLGDFTNAPPESFSPIDLLVGGTPCQSFSIAGLRGGLADARGNLALGFCRLAQRLRPRWVVWENVPGVLSSGGGRDFGSIIGALAELGYGWAYRILDAQHFGVPQRRRRVFLVGHLGDWRAAAAVLFERSCLRWDSPPRRASRADVAGSLGGGSGSRGWSDDFDRSGAFIPVAPTLQANGRAAGSATQQDAQNGALIVGQCHGGSVGPMGTLRGGDNTTSGVPFVARAVSTRGGGQARPERGDLRNPLASRRRL
jgi:DNA (cytosine-5)-methyltransferase 1